jgi:murein DD-endopeptidase MepM/ murein hydrolase activator NlpD
VNRSVLVLLGLGALASILVACALFLAAAGPLDGANAAASRATRVLNLARATGLAPVGVTIVLTPTPSLTPSDTPTATATVPTATASNTLAPTDTPAPTATPTLTVTPGPSPTLTPFPPDHPPEDHFWLARPIPHGFVDFVDRNYLYGTTQSGKRVPHHGVEFQNPSGVPVIAAAPGTVVVAGNDWTDVYGPDKYFYGNLVVVELDQRYRDQPVYTLYGHLASIAVSTGQRVQTGDQLGAVGGTGVALGPHLHFEVRVGQDDYYSTRNPELWLAPFEGWGALAGRVLDSHGETVHEIVVDVRSVRLDDESAEPIVRFVSTYAQESLNGDDEYQENFVIGDLPPGVYSVAVSGQGHAQTITVTRGRTAWVVLLDRDR